MKILLTSLLLTCGLSFAQEETLDVRFLATQRTNSSPFALPIRVNTQGEITFFGKDSAFPSFQPIFMGTWSKATINYSQPVILNRFNFYPPQRDLGWIEVKRLRYEYGAGLSAILERAFTLGLIPYKGAMQTLISHKTSREEKSLLLSMPDKLRDLEDWKVEDLGTFQTYGGVQAYAGVSAGIIDLATLSFGLQNQFVIELRKLSDKEISMLISEENLDRRELILGPAVSEATYANFHGKRFSIEFTLSLSNPEHHTLFAEALKGNLSLVQQKLPVRKQRLKWFGNDRHFYFGLPGIAGIIRDRGHYDMDQEGIETKLDFTGRRNRGFLTPLRNHQDFVYQTDEGMVVVWASEMNKASIGVVEDRFLSKGRIIGVRGFDRKLPDDTRFGSVVSQIGIHITRKELAAVNGIRLQEMRDNLKKKCEEEKLSCRKEKNLSKIIATISGMMQRPWKEFRGELGLLLLKEPAVIYAVVKTLKYKKEVYFKFLSEKFQSLEGSSPIEL